MHTVNEIRTVINKNGGTVAPTSHMFDRRGRIELQKQEDASYVNIFEWAVEADAEDVEEVEDGAHIILCEVTATASCAAALEKVYDSIHCLMPQMWLLMSSLRI